MHITHAHEDEAWVRDVLRPELGLTEGQYWTRAEDDLEDRAAEASSAPRPRTGREES